MITPERSDVDINVLFKWGKEINIYDVNNEILFTCYVRLIGDADINKARVFALRKSAELRKKMRQPDSDERLAYIADKDNLTKDDLVKYVLLLESKKFGEDAYKEIDIKFPKEPASDATLEQQEEYQQKVDSYPSRVNLAARELVTKKIEEEQKRLEEFDLDQLYQTYQNTVINDMCEMEMIKAFRDDCVYFGTYTDGTYKERTFKSVEEYQSLPTEIKHQFEEEYDSIEIDVETLKKLREAMPLPGFGV